jgi:gamma-glutamylcyclotransferase (GGCT)/AIG2-like uncharacterized protein YtfP
VATPLFVYGTLRSGERNAGELDRIPGGTRRRASARGTLATRGQGGPYPYPAITLDEAAPEVPGELFSAPTLEEHWERLDAFEGEEYRRVRTTVDSAEGPVEAWVYELRPGY